MNNGQHPSINTRPKSIDSKPQQELKIWMQYLGAMTVLGRMSRRATPHYRSSIDHAFEDLNKVLHETGSDVIYDRDNMGGWSPFSVDQISAVKARKNRGEE